MATKERMTIEQRYKYLRLMQISYRSMLASVPERSQKTARTGLRLRFA